jgi:hypothetical protein
MAFGGDDVSISIGGDSQGLQNAVRAGQQALSSLNSAVADGNGTWRDFQFNLGTIGSTLLDNLGPLGSFMVGLNSTLGVVGALVTPIQDLVQGIISFSENLASISWDVLQQGIDLTQQLAQQIFDLNNQTEKNVYSWQFLYGGQQNAHAMADWTSQFSMQIPYTRQDLMNAVTSLGRLGYSSSTIEQYMPLLADLGTLNPNLSLTDIAQVIAGAKMGLSRQLRYELGINPQDLQQYGLQMTGIGHITNPDMLLPALERWAQHRGLTGAASGTAHNTFWGEWSSFVDRLQNWALRAGGTDLSGNVSKGSFFGSLKDDLNGISSWIDAHQQQLGQLADLVSKLFGAGVQTASNALTDFLQALHRTGLDTTLERDLANFAQWLAEPSTQQGIAQFTTLVGNLLGVAGLDLRGFFEGFWQGLTSSGLGQAILQDIQDAATWLSDPSHQAEIKQLGQTIGSDLGGVLQALNGDLKTLIGDIDDFKQHIKPQDLKDLGDFFGGLAQSIGDAAQALYHYTMLLVDYYHIARDVQGMNYGALSVDIQQAARDSLLAQGYTPQQIADLGLGGGSSGSAAVGHAAAHLRFPAAPHAAAAAAALHPHLAQAGQQMSATVAASINANLPVVDRATRDMVHTLADGLNQHLLPLAQDIGGTLADNIRYQVHQQLQQQSGTQGNLALRQPGGYRGFGWIG